MCLECAASVVADFSLEQGERNWEVYELMLEAVLTFPCRSAREDACAFAGQHQMSLSGSLCLIF